MVNEFLIGWREAGIIAVEVQTHITNANLNPGYNMEALWTNWHRHCFTWKASEKFKVCLFIEMFLLYELMTYRSSSIVNFASFRQSLHIGFNHNSTSLSWLMKFRIKTKI